MDENDNVKPTRDSNGTVLNEGDSVSLIKDLNAKGAGVLKRGTTYKGIRLTEDPAEIEVGSGRGTLVLKTMFVKKA